MKIGKRCDVLWYGPEAEVERMKNYIKKSSIRKNQGLFYVKRQFTVKLQIFISWGNKRMSLEENFSVDDNLSGQVLF